MAGVGLRDRNRIGGQQVANEKPQPLGASQPSRVEAEPGRQRLVEHQQPRVRGRLGLPTDPHLGQLAGESVLQGNAYLRGNTHIVQTTEIGRGYADAMGAKSRIRVARIYQDVDPDDGQRVLVDRIWPRGIRKSDPRVGIWCKDVAPSKELRDWYHHQPERFDEFASRYAAELTDNAALDELRTLARRGVVTLVSATRDIDESHAAVLAKLLNGR
jgi:uncharacterized protein YeaO (DUF488 family)